MRQRFDPRFHQNRTNAGRNLPPRRRKIPGPAKTPAKIPRSGKERRRMLKAAAWRLSKMINVSAADAILMGKVDPRQVQHGDARRLAWKINALCPCFNQMLDRTNN